MEKVAKMSTTKFKVSTRDLIEDLGEETIKACSKKKEHARSSPSWKQTIEQCHDIWNSRELLCWSVLYNPLECDPANPNSSQISLKLALFFISINNIKKMLLLYAQMIELLKLVNHLHDLEFEFALAPQN